MLILRRAFRHEEAISFGTKGEWKFPHTQKDRTSTAVCGQGYSDNRIQSVLDVGALSAAGANSSRCFRSKWHCQVSPLVALLSKPTVSGSVWPAFRLGVSILLAKIRVARALLLSTTNFIIAYNIGWGKGKQVFS